MRTIAFLFGLLLVAPVRAETPASCPFGPGALPVDTLPPGAPHGNAIPINHIVVLMQENRSFDHYFARLHGKDIDRASRKATNPNPLGGDPVGTFHQSNYCEVADLPHSWNATHREWNGGAMDGFATENAIAADPTGSRTMGYYRRRDLKFYFKLYRTFAMSDRHFCSLLGPTFPNRHFLLSGTSAGHIRNDIVVATHASIFELLDAAGVTWKIYASDLPFGALYAYVQAHPNTAPIAQFYADAAAGVLPQVTFVDPIFFGDESNQNDEHPPNNVQLGQAFVAGVVQAMFTSPQWSDSALFITYDEHGGFYDHVPPPPACVPDAIPPNLLAGDVVAAFDRYGIRVPFVVVSPFARRKYVSHTVTDQTSVLRFIQTRFDLPALTNRDANADPLLEFFDFASPPFMTPPNLPAATIDPDHPGCAG